QFAQKELRALGIKTVYSEVLPAEPSAYKPAADQVAASGAQMVVLGSPGVPSVSAFVQAFQQKYNPKVFICASGPDQGTAFLSAVGKANATGIMVPNGWYGAYNNPLSNVMVKEYIAKYGGTASAISADVAEAYSVAEVVADAVKATHGTDNKKIIQYLHSGVTLNTVQGAAHFARSAGTRRMTLPLSSSSGGTAATSRCSRSTRPVHIQLSTRSRTGADEQVVAALAEHYGLSKATVTRTLRILAGEGWCGCWPVRHGSPWCGTGARSWPSGEVPGSPSPVMGCSTVTDRSGRWLTDVSPRSRCSPTRTSTRP
ncbi:MAG TPA: ABC transporter substrate-binding protein, partial [Streptosporangiaceae bacterium]